jgi:hypothetical protein
MQDTIRQLVLLAGYQEAARIRYLKGYDSPSQSTHEGRRVHHASWLPALPSSHQEKAPSMFLKFIQVLRQRHGCVMPAGSLAGNAKAQPESPHECSCLLGGPTPPLEKLLPLPVESLPADPHGALLQHLCTPAAVRSCVAQQAACILGHLDSSPVNRTSDILGQGSRDPEAEAQQMDEGALNVASGSLMNSTACQNLIVSQPGCMQRTMLACEGIAINSLFDHGTPTSTVCISRNLSRFVETLSSEDSGTNNVHRHTAFSMS